VAQKLVLQDQRAHDYSKNNCFMTLIRTRQLVKSYGIGEQIVHALDGVSVSIDQGEFVAIVGASGSGKSTFMNMIGCLDQPSSGSYDLGGEDVANMSSDELADLRNRRIGFIFQQFNLLARTSALENVALPLLYARVGSLAGLSKEQRYEHAKQRLEQVGLGERLQNTPSQLSGGQQQRVAIARALVNDPDLILADEPTGALDSKTSAEVMALLTQLNQQGMTVVVVTHEPEVAAYASRTITFKDGRIIDDSPNKKVSSLGGLS
jgi:putative ABC transport system ATP-binding protein